MVAGTIHIIAEAKALPREGGIGSCPKVMLSGLQHAQSC